ncbi:hypothetical protein [Vibrio splendidus]|uniref:hypothetical protein n=1 Tax=Vibrio splendidus TaxID=29497 RepID=UPI000C844E12|nr:hypothetical protein BCU38_20855 [Vibrio splendidus]
MFIQSQSRGKYLMGVCKKGNKYAPFCNDSLRGGRIWLRTSYDEGHAFKTYILKKTELAQEIAYHTNLVPQQHVKDALITFYPNLRSSIIH